MKKNSKTGAVILIALGLLCAVSAMKSCGTKRAAMQEKVDDVVYVGQGSYDPANDGKTVIVCGELKVLEPAYDDELGLTIDAPRAMRSAKKMKLKKWNLPATEENMEWNSDLGVGGMEIFQGKADVGAYHLSEEFIDNLMLGKEYEFDEEMLSGSLRGRRSALSVFRSPAERWGYGDGNRHSGAGYPDLCKGGYPQYAERRTGPENRAQEKRNVLRRSQHFPAPSNDFTSGSRGWNAVQKTGTKER